MQSFGSIAIYVGSVLGVTIGMYLYTVEAWLKPFEPVLYLAAFIVAAFAILAGLWFRDAKIQAERGVGEDGMSAEEVSLRRLTELTGQFVLGCVALLVMLTWSVPHVRALWVSYISNNPIQLGYALEDRSPRVLERACDAMFEVGVGPWRERMAERLSKTPGVAVKCIQRAVENQRSSSTVVARMVSDTWTRELRRSTEYESFDACQKTDALKAMGAIRKTSVELPLLECAFGAHSVSARECCAKSSSSVSALGSSASPASPERGVVLTMLPDILRVAYAPSDDDLDVSEALSLSTAEEQKHAFQLACAFLPAGEESDVALYLSESIAGGSCLPTDVDTSTILSTNSWRYICNSVAEGQPATRNQICAELNEFNVEFAIETAKNWSNVAATKYNRTVAANQTYDSVRKGAALGGGGGRKKDPRLLEPAYKRFGLATTTDSRCRVMVSDSQVGPGVLSLGKNRRVIETTDCDRVDPALTAWEYLRQNRKYRQDSFRLSRAPFSKKNDGILKERIEKSGRRISTTNRSTARAKVREKFKQAQKNSRRK